MVFGSTSLLAQNLTHNIFVVNLEVTFDFYFNVRFWRDPNEIKCFYNPIVFSHLTGFPAQSVFPCCLLLLPFMNSDMALLQCMQSKLLIIHN